MLRYGISRMVGYSSEAKGRSEQCHTVTLIRTQPEGKFHPA